MDALDNLSTYRLGDRVRVVGGPYGNEGDVGKIVEIMGTEDAPDSVATVVVEGRSLAFYAREIEPVEVSVGDAVRVLPEAWYVVERVRGDIGTVEGVYLPESGYPSVTGYVLVSFGEAAQFVAPEHLRVVDRAVLEPEEESEEDAGACPFCDDGVCALTGEFFGDTEEGAESLLLPVEDAEEFVPAFREGDLVRYVGPRVRLAGAVGRVFRDPRPGEDFLLIQWSTNAPEDQHNGRYVASDFVLADSFEVHDEVLVLLPDNEDLSAMSNYRATVVETSGVLDEGTVAVALQTVDGSGPQRVIVPDWLVSFQAREDLSFPEYVHDDL